MMLAQPNFENLRRHLQAELVSRCKSNPRYSLRAFARSLQVDASLLSKILKGQRTVGKKTLVRLVERLGLSPDGVERMLSPETAAKNDSVGDYKQLTLDHFHLISDWYHFALFELLEVKGFQSSTKWVAKTLGISVAEATAAFERLERLGLAARDAKGNWTRTTDHITTVGNDFTAVAFRKLQRQVLEMGIAALEELPMDVRDQSSLTVSMNRKRLPEVKTKIKEFRRELCRFLESDRERHDVYHLSVSFYPVSKTGVVR